MSECNDEINFGDNVIVYVDPKTIKCISLTDKHFIDTKFGRFYHDQFVGKKYGTVIETNTKKGFVYCFKLDPDFFTLTLSHHTQILYYADISLVIYNLGLSKGSIVCESGRVIRVRKWFYDIFIGNSSGEFGFCYNIWVQRTKAEEYRRYIQSP